jgi:hypothetical protein
MGGAGFGGVAGRLLVSALMESGHSFSVVRMSAPAVSAQAAPPA